MKTIFAELITIGDEILYGQITDTNSQWLSAELDAIGIKVIRKSSIGDQREEILTILKEAEKRASVILITGGLGPTNDDVTKKTLADFFDCPLELYPPALEHLNRLFSRRGRVLTDTNKSQALLPSTCTYLQNEVGTAPGMWFERDGVVFVSMPGVPFEMKELMTNSVLPKLKEHNELPYIIHKIIRTIGIGESDLADRIKDWEESLPEAIKLAYLPSIGDVKLRLTGYGDDKTTLMLTLTETIEKLSAYIQSFIFAYEDVPLEKILGDALSSLSKSIGVAESCTGGYLSHLFTSVPNSSAYYFGGIIAYQNSIKQSLLGVQESTLREYGAVSEQTVREMAEGVRLRLSTDIGVATTGIVGPGGGSDEKPVGTVWIAYSDHEKTISRKVVFGIRREVNIRLAAYAVLDLIRQSIVK